LSPGGKATKPAAVLLLSSVQSAHFVGAPGKATNGIVTQLEGTNAEGMRSESNVKIKRRPFSFVGPKLRSAPAKSVTGKKGNGEDAKKGGAGKENVPAPVVTAPTNSLRAR
jgi:hypothetical protein